MACTAIELNGWDVRSAADRVHVDVVIQFECAWITRGYARNRTQRREFRMAVFETSNVRCVPRRVAAGLQIGVTFGASLIVGRGGVDAPPVFGMTRRTRGCSCLRCVVPVAVFAVEATDGGSFRGE